MDRPRKKMKGEIQEDRISQLPKEILISILSRLPSKQSARTSILAKSWKNLWIHSVKQALIVFPSSDFDFITNISICNQKTQGINVQDIFTNCCLLERLSLAPSDSVKYLNVSNKLLKKLEIIGCCNLRKIDFDAPKLVSFKYNGPDTEFGFLNVSSLVELSLVESYCKFVVRSKFKQFESILEQLERINLIQDFNWIDKFPKVDGLRNIKKVRLDLRVWDYQKPFHLFYSILLALPSLEVFSLRLCWHPDHRKECTNLNGPDIGDQKHGLRVFKMDGFTFSHLDLAVIDYVVEITGSLEKIDVRLSRRESVESDEDTMDAKTRESLIHNAEQKGYRSWVKLPTRFVLH